jgi:hypothetical protein
MRAWRYGTVLCLAVAAVATAGMYWSAGTRQVRIAPPEDRPMIEVATNPDLGAEVARYRAEGKDWPTKRQIANDIAASRTQLWEECGRKLMTAHEDDRLALAHFASAYFKRGPRQQEELVSLLHSQDVKLVNGLLHFLTYTVELGPNGEWQIGKGLGGAEVARHIAGVYKTHPALAASVASTLGTYRAAAKGEVATLLRIALSQNWAEVFQAKMALLQVDRNGVYSQFDLGELDQPLTDEQRTAIEKYLAGHGGGS